MVSLFIIMTLLSANIPSGVVYIKGEKAGYKKVAEYIKDADVVFVGEKHHDQFSVEWEKYIWQIMSNDSDVVLSLEMFERDVQPYMDKYLKGEISLDTMLAYSRPWNNYMSDYNQLVSVAKEKNIPVLCSNVPRYLANMVAKKGLSAMNDYKDNERKWVNTQIDTTNSEYKERFLNTMKMIHGENSPMAKMMNPLYFYYAQIIKDATMAQSIEKELDKGKKVFMVTGSFHCDYHSGIIDQFEKKWNIITIHPQGEDEEDLSKDIADIVIYRDE